MIGKSKGYAKLSNGFWRDIKIRKLIAQNQWKAIATYALALSYCGDGLTDGRINEDELLYQLNSDQETIKALVDSHLLAADGDGSYTIHNYLEWQRSKDDVEKAAAQSAERVKKWRTKQKRTCNAHVTPLQRPCNADVTEKPRTQNPEPKINKRECREKTSNHENNQPHSQAPSLKVEANEESWKDGIRSWEPKPDHFERARRLQESGYPAPDILALAHEFKNSVVSKGNKYGYVDFDAAFHTWIDKRAGSLRERRGAARATSMPQAFTDAERRMAQEESLRAKAEMAAWRAAHPGESMFKGYPHRKPGSTPGGEHAPASPARGSGNDEHGGCDKSTGS